MSKTFISILLFSLLAIPSSKAQVFNTNPHYASGMIYNDSTKSRVEFVHIFNESKHIGAISDEQGKFRFRADAGDTLVFMALGYLGKVVIVNEAMIQSGEDVFLSPRYYEIEEVDIVSFGTYENFKKKFIALEAHKTEAHDLRDRLYAQGKKEALAGIEQEKVRRAIIGQPGTEPINGIPILYKEDLQRLNYARVLKLEEKQRAIYKKYNFDIVKQVTKLPDEEILEFMSFCKFSMQYLLNASEYEILTRIEQKYNEYLKIKSKGELQHIEDSNLIFYT